jgi:lipopolysaccharide/colanic/teichoic acid biosynthesis glycosyltransferase
MTAAGLLERAIAAGALVLLSPLLAFLAFCIVAESGLPVIYRQERVGRGGRRFLLVKLRSMRTSASGSKVTAGGDARITRVGTILRKYKLD